ncbi:type VII secretion target [Longispora sp. K20-0274]|uniref:type VII secretion target n=1 Tax=Longispora sp. K20-0274 TaxID=3088255 RepID=UPI003999BEE9
MSKDIDSVQLRSAAGQLDTIADDLDTALTTFFDKVSAMGEPWGADLIGMAIGPSYLSIERVAQASYGSVVTGLDKFVAGLNTMADRYDENEDDIAAHLAKISW